MATFRGMKCVCFRPKGKEVKRSSKELRGFVFSQVKKETKSFTKREAWICGPRGQRVRQELDWPLHVNQSETLTTKANKTGPKFLFL